MDVPLEISFRNIEKTKAIEDLIRKKADKLEQICNHLVSCHLAIEKLQQHHKSGNPCRVRIDIRVPPRHELVITCESREGDMHDALNIVLRKAFHTSHRQLQKLLDHQRGKVKRYSNDADNGIGRYPPLE